MHQAHVSALAAKHAGLEAKILECFDRAFVRVIAHANEDVFIVIRTNAIRFQ